MSKSFKHPANPERVRAENERRRSNAAVPYTTKHQRLRTDERIVAAAVREMEDEFAQDAKELDDWFRDEGYDD